MLVILEVFKVHNFFNDDGHSKQERAPSKQTYEKEGIYIHKVSSRDKVGSSRKLTALRISYDDAYKCIYFLDNNFHCLQPPTGGLEQ